ncbi:MAG: hypothetical protein ACKO8O_16345, partial [Betaproteobacteria bacterium]
ARVATGRDESAIGLALENLNFGLALATAVDQTDQRSWMGVEAEASRLTLLGTEAIGLTLSGTDLSIRMNMGLGINAQGTANTVTADWSKTLINLPASSAADTVRLDLSGNVFEVAGSIDLGLADTLELDGGEVVLCRQELDVQIGGRTQATTGFLIGANGVSVSMRGLDVSNASLALALLRPVDVWPTTRAAGSQPGHRWIPSLLTPRRWAFLKI